MSTGSSFEEGAKLRSNETRPFVILTNQNRFFNPEVNISKMEKSVETLEAMFQKTESDLDYLSRKLDFEFDSSNNAEANPVRLMAKVNEIKKEYANIVQEAVAIQEAQKEAMDYFRTQLLSACQMLQRLQTETGSEGATGEEKSEAMNQLEQLLGVDTSSLTQSGQDPSPTNTFQPQTSGGGDNSTQPAVSEPQAEEPAALSPRSRRDGCKEFIEVSPTEFESVSSLIRGRVKLTDVNMTYNTLWRHFKEEGNSKSLKTTDMHKMGMRVSGATGEAKLKVLRALKLLNMTAKGDVTLV